MRLAAPFVFLMSAAVLGAGCAKSPASPADTTPQTLVGSWTVIEIDNGGPVEDAVVTIVFGADGKLGGRSACNRYGGGFTFGEGVLKTGPLQSTRMACPPALMDLELKFLNRLEGELSVAAGEAGAVILSDDEGRIVIRPSG